MKVMLSFGTRPEAIKMAPVVKAFKKIHGADVRVCVTAQHRSMLDQVMSTFRLDADYDLNLMRPDQDLADITSGVVLGLRSILLNWRPDVVLVHGDTASAFSAALAAFYQKIPVGHVEAGLRTGEIMSPWPEEGNRKLIAAIARWNFAPTNVARDNLIKEGVAGDRVHVTGNTAIDSINYIIRKIGSNDEEVKEIRKNFKFIEEFESVALVTAHRRENFGEGIKNICKAVREIANQNPRTVFVFPVHPNPMIKSVVEKDLSELSNVKLCDPMDYVSFIYVMTKSHLILTDSGGIQEECVTLNVPTLLMRNHTERPESIAHGTVILVGDSTENIKKKANEILGRKRSEINNKNNPYGDGFAAERISNIIFAELRK